MFAVTPRTDPRPPVTWRSRGRWAGWGYVLPALVVVTVIIIASLVMTVAASLRAPSGYRALVLDPQFGPALRNNLAWVGFTVVTCVLGLGLAYVARSAGARSRRVLTVALVIPAVISPLTAGIAFRIIFDHRPERGPVAAVVRAALGPAAGAGDGSQGYLLGAGWIWVLLGAAFVWQWTGVAFLAFHDGLRRVREDLVRIARIFAPGPWSKLRLVLIPTLLPSAAVAGLIVLLAATRTFEIVLVAVPGSLQDQVDVLGLFWWRQSDVFVQGEREALGVLLFLIPAAAALTLLWRLRKELPSSGPSGAARLPSRATGRWTWVLPGLVAAVWLTPIAALLLASFHAPVDVARSGLLNGDYGLESYQEALSDGSLLAAMVPTATRAVLVAVLVVLTAVPAAYGLTHAGMRRRTAGAFVAFAAVFATIPPQAIAVPLGRTTAGLAGGPVTLSLIHAALVLPLAVLLLRGAFASVPRSVVDRPLAQGESAFRRVVEARLPAVLTVAVLAAVSTWNDLVVSLLLSWPSADQVPLVVWQQSRYFATSAGPLAAESVLAGVVPVALVLANGRLLAEGLTTGVDR